ncbi:NAD(P)/FAD-dependent oxidoreductase [Brevibacterium linens]|uniref:NAD(P)/FAD-dependent oxidoreductase n=1 Tax=Brevibacterium linens TaxID=1703 RepID=UPI003BF579D9
MSTPESIVVIGAGLAGAKTVEELRSLGFTGPLTLIGEESHAPYERPALSKEYLAGSAEFTDSLVHPLEWYAENSIDLRLNTSATAFDAAAHTVTLSDGSTVDYGALVLATGAAPRRASIPGADAEGVLYLRTKEDSDAIRAAAVKGKKLAIIGGGWIGLEVAAGARNAGADVAVLELDPLPLARIVGDRAAEAFASLHRDKGVDLHTNAEAAEILVADGHVTGVKLKDGTLIDADTVLVGIGAIPNIALAEAAGLTIEAGGVAVDAQLRTSDADVFAVGDIAAQNHPVLGRRVRVEHWATALNQPKAVAATLTGTDTDFTELPYFFTDQYDLGMEYIGSVPRGVQPEVVFRGDLESREFIAYYLNADGAILAAMAVNIWDVIDNLKALILSGKPVDRARLEDSTVAISEL